MRRLLVLAIALVCLLVADAALARSELLHWTQDMSGTPPSRFMAHGAWTGGSADYDLGFPTPTNGVYAGTFPNLPDTGTVSFYLTGLAADGTPSQPSNTIQRTAGGTTPPPSSISVTYQIRNGSAVVGPLAAGGTIPAGLSCPWIEILPNPLPGSLAKTLDGATPTFADHGENNSPYGYLDDNPAAGSAACSALPPGAHTLRTRFWSGSSGGASVLGDASLAFTVASATPPAKPPKPVKPRLGLNAPDAPMWTVSGDGIPVPLCTAAVPNATAYHWLNEANGETFDTTTPKVLIHCPSPMPSGYACLVKLSVVASASGVDSDRSDPSDVVRIYPPYGTDLDGDGLMLPADFAAFIPSFQAGAKSCAPVGGVSPCGC